MLTPINNVYSPLFRHQCAMCGQWTESPQLMAAESFGRFVCRLHWTIDEHVAATREYAEQVRTLSPEQKHALRVQIFGESRTREIEKGAR